jgi:hypothetical protein
MKCYGITVEKITISRYTFDILTHIGRNQHGREDELMSGSVTLHYILLSKLPGIEHLQVVR